MDGIFIMKASAAIAAAIAMGFGSIMPAYGQGLVGSKACENIGKYPESARDIRAAMFLSLILIETSAIYCFLISIGLMAIIFYL